jgi:exonuclease SbcC
MIPKSLTIKGLYSYQSEQTIDFEALSAAHLFGIFGKVGAGKSSILEAIMYALYGEVERLGVQGRNYNMLNLSATDLLILFQFDIGEKQYLSKVTGKRNSRNREDVKIEKPLFFERIGANLTPLSIETAEPLIGLKMNDFKKTIIIPQGTFQAFLQLGDTERTRMMRELFGLERYELEPKVKILQDRDDTKAQILRGQKAQIGAIDEQLLNAKLVELADLQKLIKTLQNDLDKKRKTDADWQILKIDFETWDKLKTAQIHLSQAEPEFISLEKQVADYELAYSQFKNTLEHRQRLRFEFEKNRREITLKTEKLNHSESQIAKWAEALQKINLLYENRDKLKTQADELRKISAIQTHETAIQTRTSRQAVGLQYLNQKMAAIADLKKSALAIENQKAEWRARQINLQELNAVKDWFSISLNYQREINRLETELKGVEEKLRGIEKSKAVIVVKDLPPLSIQAAFDWKLSDIIAQVKTAIGQTKQTEDALSHELLHLKAAEKLDTLAHALQEGEPCPLCGATHHPSVWDSGTVQPKIRTMETQFAQLKAQLRTMENIETELNTLLINFNNDKEAGQKLNAQLTEMRKRIDVHDQTFVWTSYDRRNYAQVEQAIAAAAAFDSQMQAFEQSAQNLSIGIEKAQKDADRYRDELAKIQADLSADRASVQVLKGQIAILTQEKSLTDWLTQSQETLLTLAETYENQFVQVEIQYRDIEKKAQMAQSEAQILRGGILALENAKTTLMQDLEALEKSVESQIAQSLFPNLAAVEAILKTPIDLPVVKAKIEQFKNQKLLVQAREQEMAQKLSGKTYDLDTHTQLLAEIQTLTMDLELENQNLGRLKMAIEDLKTKLSQLAVLNDDLKRLDFRSENLKILRGLFQKSGFVNYASSMFLQSICAAANQRFTKLTKHQLQLEITASNSFILRDMVNSGQLRDVRTLSGGQTFQAALSLALALSDHIQSRQALPQKFFFLDEGFGSLDRESLTVVFDTLKSLQRENRVVGVISHVEDMQQEIDRYLQVRFDEQLGSQVALRF